MEELKMMISDKDIELAKKGDSKAFARIYTQTVKTAYFVAKRILLDYPEEEIEDVLQDAYIAVYKNLNKYEAGNFQGWIDVIVANRAKNFLKKKKPTLFCELESEDTDALEIQFEDENIEFRPDEQMDYTETKRLVMDIVDALPEEQRLAVILYYFDEIGVKDIAKACDCSENTIKSRLNYARKNIKLKVEELEKKGTKLYAIPIIPFIAWMLREECKANVVSAAVLNVKSTASVIGKTSAKAGVSAGAKAAIGMLGTVIIIGGAVGAFMHFGNKAEVSLSDNSSQIYTTLEDDGGGEEKVDYEIAWENEKIDEGHTYSFVQIKNWDNSSIDEWNTKLKTKIDTDATEYQNIYTEILAQTANYLSVRIYGDEYYRGAMHPNQLHIIYNINMKTGEVCELSDYIDFDAYSRAVAKGEFSSDYDGDSDAIINQYIKLNNYSYWSVYSDIVELVYEVPHAYRDTVSIRVKADGIIKR